MNLLSRLSKSWFPRYVLIAVVAFSLGGATVVQAVAPGGIMGVVQLADRTDNTHLAAVDASGNLGVKVSNFPAAQEPYQQVVFDTIANGSFYGGATFVVPQGKRLVVQFATFSICVPVGQEVTAELTGGDLFRAAVPLEQGGVCGPNSHDMNVFSGSEQVLIFIEPGQTVGVFAARFVRNQVLGPSGAASVAATISGYLVNP